MTFAEKFCARHGIPPEQYEGVVLRLTLRPVARLLCPLLNLNPAYFAADREYIRSVGRITTLESLGGESLDFIMDPDGRGFLHRTLKLRVSRRRLGNLVRDTMRD